MRSTSNQTYYSQIQLFDSPESMKKAENYRNNLYNSKSPDLTNTPTTKQNETTYSPSNKIKTSLLHPCPTCGCNGNCNQLQTNDLRQTSPQPKTHYSNLTSTQNQPNLDQFSYKQNLQNHSQITNQSPKSQPEQPEQLSAKPLKMVLFETFSHKIFDDKTRVQFAQSLTMNEKLLVSELIPSLKLLFDQGKMIQLIQLFRPNLQDFDDSWDLFLGLFKKQHYKDSFLKEFGLR